MVQQVATRRIIHSMMLRDDLDGAVSQSQKPNHTAETQNPSEEPVKAEPAEDPERRQPDSKEPKKEQLQLLHWSEHQNQHIDFDIWCKPVRTGANAESLPTHVRPFSSHAEYKLVKHTYHQLQHSAYYWGPMTMEEAHKILTRAQLGTFLIRDSGQTRIFFTLSYQSEDGPTSVRILLNDLLFSLHGSQKTFASLFDLLNYYTSSSCKLTVPYRKRRLENLKQICRRALIHTYGADNLSTLPGLSKEVKDYVSAYPHCI